MNSLHDVNEFIVKDQDATLNLLHILAANRENPFNLKCIELLLKQPNLNINLMALVQMKEKSAAHLAVEWGNGQILKLLVDHKCDLFLCDSYGMNVQDCAEKSKRKDLIRIINDGVEQWLKRASIDPSFDAELDELYNPVVGFDDYKSNSTLGNDTELDLLGDDTKNDLVEDNDTFDYTAETEETIIAKCASGRGTNETFTVSLESFYSTPAPIKKSSKTFLNISSDSLNKTPEAERKTSATFIKSPDSVYMTPAPIKKNVKTLNVSSESLYKTPVAERKIPGALIKSPDSIYMTPAHSNHDKFLEDGNVTYEKSNLSDVSIDTQATEIYWYKDDEIELIEERYDGSDVLKLDFPLSPENDDDADNQNDSNSSRDNSIDELILKMTNTQLAEALTEKGFKPGPINSTTRVYYQKKFSTELKDQVQSELQTVCSKHNINRNDSILDPLMSTYRKKLANYPLEFFNLINGKFPFHEAIKLETMLVKEFESSDNGSNTYFVYMILDPEITNNLPQRANECFARSLPNGHLELINSQLFASFILSIFYVGKGNSSRAYQHFYEAFRKSEESSHLISKQTSKQTLNLVTGEQVPSSFFARNQQAPSICPKTQRILDIWSKNRGPVSLHCFTGISSNEAFTREALMIEALSLTNLTNKICGQYRCDLKMNLRQKNILGTYLLFKAFTILLINGERQVHKPVAPKNGKPRR